AVVAVSVDGAQNIPTGDPNGPDGEVELDLEVAGSVAPGARLVAYFAPNTDRGFLDGLTRAIHDSTHRPSIVSISWGGPESSWTGQARAALAAACEDAATMGISILVAAGDHGAGDGVPTGGPTVDFPASSPYVTACGGTRLLMKASQIASEVVWNELAIGEGATGGGVSQSFPLPSYQLGANVPKAPNGFVGRGVPDVAGDADPASGYSVRVDGSDTVIGGTSAVAPLWAALLARVNQSLGAAAGFVNPLLYSPAGVASFHDITSGNNDGYSAGPGWDPCTGWGTPDGSRLLLSLRSPPASP
ncbi:MAG: S53 family peptidase, partial [Thermoplasmata archaeon]